MVGWSVCKVVPFPIDANNFVRRPPISLCLYSLKKGSLTEEDQRHLESRRQYYFRVDFWSSKKPPSQNQIEQLFPKLQKEPTKKKTSSVRQRRSWKDLWACCSAPRHRSDSVS